MEHTTPTRAAGGDVPPQVATDYLWADDQPFADVRRGNHSHHFAAVQVAGLAPKPKGQPDAKSNFCPSPFGDGHAKCNVDHDLYLPYTKEDVQLTLDGYVSVTPDVEGLLESAGARNRADLRANVGAILSAKLDWWDEVYANLDLSNLPLEDAAERTILLEARAAKSGAVSLNALAEVAPAGLEGKLLKALKQENEVRKLVLLVRIMFDDSTATRLAVDPLRQNLIEPYMSALWCRYYGTDYQLLHNVCWLPSTGRNALRIYRRSGTLVVDRDMSRGKKSDDAKSTDVLLRLPDGSAALVNHKHQTVSGGTQLQAFNELQKFVSLKGDVAWSDNLPDPPSRVHLVAVADGDFYQGDKLNDLAGIAADARSCGGSVWATDTRSLGGLLAELQSR